MKLFFSMPLIFLCLSFSTFSQASVSDLIKRDQKIELTTSVAVPCIYKHFVHLKGLLESYSQQTCLPHDIVISLSGVENLDQAEIDSIENYPWPFKLNIMRHIGKRSEGDNRSMAVLNSEGDVILCQDADDLPHPQRVEVVKYLFENFYVDHIMHTLIQPGVNFSIYSIENIKALHHETYINEVSGGIIANGSPCISREVFNRIQWSTDFRYGIDTEFNQKVYANFANTVIVHNPLLLYRLEYSTLSLYQDSLLSN